MILTDLGFDTEHVTACWKTAGGARVDLGTPSRQNKNMVTRPHAFTYISLFKFLLVSAATVLGCSSCLTLYI